MDKYDHDNPENWKWYFFYYNKKDPRIFPPKRLWYLGWTINFANPYSILATAILIIAAVYLSTHFILPLLR